MKTIVVLAMLLSGCAYISGPCEVSTAPERRAACQTGGTMVLLPGSVLNVLQPVVAVPVK